MEITVLLDELAEFQAQADYLELKRAELIDAVNGKSNTAGANAALLAAAPQLLNTCKLMLAYIETYGCASAPQDAEAMVMLRAAIDAAKEDGEE